MQIVKAISTAAHDTRANWNNQRRFIPKEGELIVYTDYRTETDSEGNIINIPGLKIGDGKGYLIDLPFISQATYDPETYAAIQEQLTAHINNTGIHVTSEEKSFWNNKINCYADGDTLVINRE